MTARILDGKELAFSDVSKDNTFELQMHEPITVWVDRVMEEPPRSSIEHGPTPASVTTAYCDARR